MFRTWIIRQRNTVWVRKLADIVTSLSLEIIKLDKEWFNVISLHGNILETNIWTKWGHESVNKWLWVIYVMGLFCKQHIVLNHVFFRYKSSGRKIRGFSGGRGVLLFRIGRTSFKLAVTSSNRFLSVVAHDLKGIAWLIASLQIWNSNNADVLLNSGLNLFDIKANLCVDSYGCPRRFLGLTHVFLACRVPWVSPMATGVTINH